MASPEAKIVVLCNQSAFLSGFQSKQIPPTSSLPDVFVEAFLETSNRLEIVPTLKKHNS